MTTFSTLALLAAESTNRYHDGWEIFVESVRDYFIVDKSGSGTSDGITQVTPASGPGRFRRAVGRQHPSWRYQTAWTINPSSGNDEGTSTVKTTAELIRRLGIPFYTLDNTTYTITIANSVPTTDPLRADFRVTDGSRVDWAGTPTTVRSNTFSAVTALNSGSQQPLTVTDGTFDWTSNVGNQIFIPTGARAGAYTWVAKANSAGVSRLGNMCTNGLNFSTALATTVTPIATDPYQTRSLPDLPIGSFNIEGASYSNPDTLIHSMSNLRVRGTGGFTASITGKNEGLTVMFSGCFFDVVQISHPSAIATNCRHNNQTTVIADGFLSVEAGIITGAGIGNFGTGLLLDAHVLAQGAGLLYANQSNTVIGQACSFDNAGPTEAIYLVGGARVIRGFSDHGVYDLWGTNNAGRAMRVHSGSHFYMRTRPTINAGLGAGREVGFHSESGVDDVLWADVPVTSSNDSSVIIG